MELIREEDREEFERFKQNVVENIKSYLPDDFRDASVDLIETIKGNDAHLTGLEIMRDEDRVAPRIYLEPYFQDLQNGIGREEVMLSIADTRVQRSINIPMSEIERLEDFEAIRGSIYPRLVNAEYNREFLIDKPYTPMEDLAVYYRVELGETSQGEAGITITNNMMQNFGVSIEDLHKEALKNLSEKELTVKPLYETLMELMYGDFKPSPEQMEEMGMGFNGLPMWVMTNKERAFGANAILDPGTMDKVREMVGGDFFAIPSSVHEFLIFPDNGEIERDEINALINSVNTGHVLPQEVLSDHLYRYDYDTHSLKKDIGEEMDNAVTVSVYRDNVLHDEHTDTVENTVELTVDRNWLKEWVSNNTSYNNLEEFLGDYDHDLMDEKGFFTAAKREGAIKQVYDVGMDRNIAVSDLYNTIIDNILEAVQNVPGNDPTKNQILTLQIIPSKTSIDVNINDLREKLSQMTSVDDKITIGKSDGFGRTVSATFTLDTIASIRDAVDKDKVYYEKPEQEEEEFIPIDEAYLQVKGYYVYVQKTEEGIDYTLYGSNMLEIDGGAVEFDRAMPDMSLAEAVEEIKPELYDLGYFAKNDTVSVIMDEDAVEKLNMLAEKLNGIQAINDVKGFAEQVATMIQTNTAWTANVTENKDGVTLELFGPELFSSHPVAFDLELNDCKTIFEANAVIDRTLNSIENSFSKGIVPGENPEWSKIPEDRREGYTKDMKDVNTAYHDLCKANHLQDRYMAFVGTLDNNRSVGTTR